MDSHTQNGRDVHASLQGGASQSVMLFLTLFQCLVCVCALLDLHCNNVLIKRDGTPPLTSPINASPSKGGESWLRIIDAEKFYYGTPTTQTYVHSHTAAPVLD